MSRHDEKAKKQIFDAISGYRVTPLFAAASHGVMRQPRANSDETTDSDAHFLFTCGDFLFTVFQAGSEMPSRRDAVSVLALKSLECSNPLLSLNNESTMCSFRKKIAVF